MTFDYEHDTRRHYRDPLVAREYNKAFSNPSGWNGLRFRFVAERERASVRKLLAYIPHRRIVDIPAGTGKMAPVFHAFGADVTCCDISAEMLGVARETYEKLGHQTVDFEVVDLEEAGDTLNPPYDAVVCIRLMHRVPDEQKRRMLKEIQRLSEWAVVSFGIRGIYNETRRRVRRILFGGQDVGLPTQCSREKTEILIRESHDIVDRRPVARWLSSEWIYLLRAKADV